MAHRHPDRTREHASALVAAVLGAGLLAFCVGALADGYQRAQEAPFSALLGLGAYTRLRGGDGGAGDGAAGLHYLAPPIAEQRLRAPDFTLPVHGGGTWRLSEQRGKVILLNFWSITCRPCVEEMPSLIDLGSRLEERQDVELVTITTDADWATVAPLFKDRAPPFRVLFDPEKQVVADRFGTRAYPETWFIDREGTIRLRVDGPKDWSQAVVLDVIDQL